MGPEIETLKHHSKGSPDPVDLFFISRLSGVSGSFHPDQFTIDIHIPFLGVFKQINTSKKRTFSGSAAPEKGNDGY